MPIQLVLPLNQCTNLSVDEIGEYTKDLSIKLNQGVPLPPAACLPIESLKYIANSANLRAKIVKILRTSDFQDHIAKAKALRQIGQLIHYLPLNASDTKQLNKIYEDFFDSSYVSLMIGHQRNRQLQTQYQNITGIENLIESILHLWSEQVYKQFQSVKITPQKIDALIFPSAIIIQKQIKAVASGVAYSLNPDTHDKKQIIILSNWGNFSQKSMKNDFDRFTIDSRTHAVIYRHLGQKKTTLTPTLDGFITKKLTQDQQIQSSLNDQELQSLAKIVQKIKQKSLEHCEVIWSTDGDNFYIYNLRYLNLDSQNLIKPSSDQFNEHRTITKLMISAGNPEKAQEQCSPIIDGIGVLRSEYTLAKFGYHPEHIIKGNQKNILKNELVNTIKTYQLATRNLPIIYRTQNFTSDELLQLKYSETYEPHESNPYLGFRGGLKSLIQPQLFKLELDAVQNVLANSSSTLGLMLPFVRSPVECHRLIAMIDKAGLTTFNHFELWLQLNTPENIYNLTDYPLHRLDGISINMLSLHALHHAIDPNNAEISNHYQPNLQLDEQIIKTVIEAIKSKREKLTLKTKLKINLHLEIFSSQLIELAIKHQLSAVTIKPAVASQARACIIDCETKKLSIF